MSKKEIRSLQEIGGFSIREAAIILKAIRSGRLTQANILMNLRGSLEGKEFVCPNGKRITIELISWI